ncbi:hypothetical protein ACWCXC_08750 [Streptomyces sp. NPDC001515]
MPAPVASTIARKAEYLFNLDGEADTEAGDRRLAVPPTAVVTTVDSRPAPHPHAAPTQAATARGIPQPPLRAVSARPGPDPFPAHTAPQLAKTHTGNRTKSNPLLWVAAASIAAVAAVAIAVNGGDTSGSAGTGSDTSSARPSGQPTNHSADPVPDKPAEQATAAPSPVTGEWRGSYFCGQGHTGLTLTISQDDSGLTATFDFYPLASNPDVPRGSFAMQGTYADARMNLYGDHWIDEPEDYLMVGLSAEVAGKTPHKITGSVTDPDGKASDSCTTFTVEKS